MKLRQAMRILGPGRKDGRNLTFEEAQAAFKAVLSGEESEVQIAAFLVMMRAKGITVQELTGFARATREQARTPCAGMPGLVSICGPSDGIDHHPPLEVAAGLITAGAGVPVLIFTDRCVAPRRGLTAASVLEGLGLRLHWDPREAEQSVEQTGFAAMALPGMLPALMGLRRVRSEVSVRTPLSTVEKLLAPTESAVVLGAMGGPVLGSAAEVIQALGHPRGIVVQGPEGGVIPALSKRTRGVELSERYLVPIHIEPEDFGLLSEVECELPLFSFPPEGMGSGDSPELVRECAAITREVLDGALGPARNSALLGAALMLKASGRALTLAEGVDAAAHSLDSGAAREVLLRITPQRRG
ncbi:MAG: anthranilate phosphoribosyltransferase [Planctomycetia bacterium]